MYEIKLILSQFFANLSATLLKRVSDTEGASLLRK